MGGFAEGVGERVRGAEVRVIFLCVRSGLIRCLVFGSSFEMAR